MDLLIWIILIVIGIITMMFGVRMNSVGVTTIGLCLLALVMAVDGFNY